MEQRSEDLAWSNRTRTPEREWGPVEKRRRGERELQKIPKPASLPPVRPSRHRFLPEISFPAAARGKIRAAHAAPQGLLSRPGLAGPRPAIPQPRKPPYPDTAPRELARAGTSPPSAPAAGPPRPPPPSARFQIEIPWLGPSEDSARQPRPLAAEAPPAPPPDAPPARKPPRAAPRPRAGGGGPSHGIR